MISFCWGASGCVINIASLRMCYNINVYTIHIRHQIFLLSASLRVLWDIFGRWITWLHTLSSSPKINAEISNRVANLSWGFRHMHHTTHPMYVAYTCLNIGIHLYVAIARCMYSIYSNTFNHRRSSRFYIHAVL